MANAILGGTRAQFGYGYAGVVVDAANTTRGEVLECISYTLNAGVTVTPNPSSCKSLIIIARDFIKIAGVLDFSAAINPGLGPFAIGGVGAVGVSPNGGAGGAGAHPFTATAAAFLGNQGSGTNDYRGPATGINGGQGGAAGLVFNGGGGGGGGMFKPGGTGGNGAGLLGLGGPQTGGYGGGGITLMAPRIIIESTASINVSGGLGGNAAAGGGAGGGGGGSGGLIQLFYQQLQDRSAGAAFNVNGGHGGSGGGSLLFGVGGAQGQAGGDGGNGVNGGGGGGGGAGGLIIMRGV